MDNEGKNKNMWHVADSIAGKERSDYLQSLLRMYNSTKEAVDAINNRFVDNFQPSDTISISDLLGKPESTLDPPHVLVHEVYLKTKTVKNRFFAKKDVS